MKAVAEIITERRNKKYNQLFCAQSPNSGNVVNIKSCNSAIDMPSTYVNVRSEAGGVKCRSSRLQLYSGRLHSFRICQYRLHAVFCFRPCFAKTRLRYHFESVVVVLNLIVYIPQVLQRHILKITSNWTKELLNCTSFLYFSALSTFKQIHNVISRLLNLHCELRSSKLF